MFTAALFTIFKKWYSEKHGGTLYSNQKEVSVIFSLLQIQRVTHRDIYRPAYIQVSIYTCISLLCQLREPKSNDISVAMVTLVARTWFLIATSHKRSQGSLEKRLILRLKHKLHKMTVEYLLVPESKEVLKKKKENHAQAQR